MTQRSPSPRVLNLHHSGVPLGAVYVGRGSKWGNPYVIGIAGNRERVIAMFCEGVLPTLDVSELRGKDLVCFCAPKHCHADHILAKANAPKGEEPT